MIVVSDTSPISNLFTIGCLEIMQKLFGTVILPQAVYTELLVLAEKGRDISEIVSAGWIEVRTAQDRVEVARLLTLLDAGESEAIVIAHEIKAELVLMDDSKGRKIAKAEGLYVVGTLGLLLEAKKRNIIDLVMPIVDDLRVRAHFRISDVLYQEVLTQSNE